MLLILHEIESGYEKKWEILKLPGGLTGFLLLHIPVVFALFYGLWFAVQCPQTTAAISLVSGIIGFLPFIVHKVFVNRKEHFNKLISNMLIYGNMVAGLILILIGVVKL